MQENHIVPTSDLYKTVYFQWKEADKGHLAVEGTLVILPL